MLIKVEARYLEIDLAQQSQLGDGEKLANAEANNGANAQIEHNGVDFLVPGNQEAGEDRDLDDQDEELLEEGLVHELEDDLQNAVVVHLDFLVLVRGADRVLRDRNRYSGLQLLHHSGLVLQAPALLQRPQLLLPIDDCLVVQGYELVLELVNVQHHADCKVQDDDEQRPRVLAREQLLEQLDEGEADEEGEDDVGGAHQQRGELHGGEDQDADDGDRDEENRGVAELHDDGGKALVVVAHRAYQLVVYHAWRVVLHLLGDDAQSLLNQLVGFDLAVALRSVVNGDADKSGRI